MSEETESAVVHRSLPGVRSSPYIVGSSVFMRASVVVFLDSLGTRARAGELTDSAIAAKRELLRNTRAALFDQDPGFETLISFTDNVLFAAPFASRKR